VQEIMRTAGENAARIEHEAAERARQIESDAARKSEEMLGAAFKRAWRILDGIDLMESGFGDMMRALRSEMEGFAADLGIALPAPRPDRSRENGADSEASHTEVEQMITEQVAILHREGRPRREAEHLVLRFKHGGDYVHIIDEVYGSKAQ
jgi:hypothetical protein